MCSGISELDSEKRVSVLAVVKNCNSERCGLQTQRKIAPSTGDINYWRCEHVGNARVTKYMK